MIVWNALNFGEGWRPDLAAEAVPQAIAELGLLPVTSYAHWRTPRTFVDLTAYLRKVWGEDYQISQMECGSCVAFGLAICADTLTAIATVESGNAGPLKRSDPMTLYWGSRVEIGGGKIRGEGSVGVWAARYAKEYGILPQQKYDAIDLSVYDPSVCCGPLSRRGVPDALEPVARQYPIRNFAQIRSFDEMVVALDLERPVTVASNQGFTQRLDAEGFARPSGSWSHQMAVLGYRLGQRPGGLVVNSWGKFFTGGPEGHNPATFWADAEVLDRMFRQNDSWAYNDMETWVPRGIDFTQLNF